MTVNLALRGLRGESTADIARRTLGITDGDKLAVQALMRDDAELADIPDRAESARDDAEDARDLSQQYAANAAAASGLNQPYDSVASAAAATIVAGVKGIVTRYYAPTYPAPATLVGGAAYSRVSLAVITAGSYPARAYFRSVDRFMPDGTTDSTNGGYWLLSSEIVHDTMLGVVVDSTADCLDALNDAAAFCRATGRKLVLPAFGTAYRFIDNNGTVDLRGIKHIDGREALIRGTWSAAVAARIGGTGTAVLTNADIWLEVRNLTDAISTAGTIGIEFGGMAESAVNYYVRGFAEGVRFDGVSGNRTWVDNHFRPIKGYNCNTHIHFDLAGSSYFIGNTFHNGGFYLGTSLKVSGAALVKVTLAGSAALAENTFRDLEIGISGGSVAADSGLLVYADINTTFTSNSLRFLNCRLERYGTWATPAPLFNIASSPSGLLNISGDFNSLHLLLVGPSIPALTAHNIEIIDGANRSTGGSTMRQALRPEPTRPYQIGNVIYVPGRTIFNANYAAPAATLTNGVSGRLSRAGVDEALIVSAGDIFAGVVYDKLVGYGQQLRLLRGQVDVNVVCWDAAGNILSGTAPAYVQGRNWRSQAYTGGTIYQASTNWLWIHPSVARFAISQSRWQSAGLIEDVPFEVTVGPLVTRYRGWDTPRDRIASASPTKLFLPAGAVVDGTATNGWRNTFLLATTSLDASVSTDTTIDLTSVAGIATGDVIGIELDTVIAGAERQYHFTTVNGAPSGSTVTLTDALPAAVAAGRRVLLNRWVAR